MFVGLDLIGEIHHSHVYPVDVVNLEIECIMICRHLLRELELASGVEHDGMKGTVGEIARLGTTTVEYVCAKTGQKQKYFHRP